MLRYTSGMNSSKLSIVFLLIAGLAAGCGKDKGGGASGDKAEAPKVSVSPAMTAFLSDLKGKSSDVTEALKTHGVDGLDNKDMNMYDLSSPTVTATEKRGDKECYTFEAKAGMTVRTYETCWANGKIAEVADKGMR
ncbi:MAG: hypothetical protein H6Q90_4380 [Deltaproteobacteria bacterium]|nr:hypothetical protein [Deltaproteobacteria bacterium]